MWSEVQPEQLAAAVCVRLHLQNIEDESRGTTQTCTVTSNESISKERLCKRGQSSGNFRPNSTSTNKQEGQTAMQKDSL